MHLEHLVQSLWVQISKANEKLSCPTLFVCNAFFYRAFLEPDALAKWLPPSGSVSFGPAKFAMRGLAQSLARDLGPKGVHVAWINVDGSIDISGARGLKPTLREGDFLKPEAIAEAYWHIAHQDPSAWTKELEVRPFKENS